MVNIVLFFGLTCLASKRVSALPYPAEEERSKEYWRCKAQLKLIKNLLADINNNKAKNVILFIGDGMGIPVISAARIYRGQSEGLVSEQTPFTFEQFPFTGLTRTYAIDRLVTDSANSATALMTGVKANFGTIGVGPEAPLDDCPKSVNHFLDSIATWAQKAGKGVGVVTTSRVTHATPASLYAHVANRNWETDADLEMSRKLGYDVSACKDIARQLVEDSPGKEFKVILGGGRRAFEQSENGGKRTDGAPLLSRWSRDKVNPVFVETRRQLLNLNYEQTGHLLGLFSSNHMTFELDRPQNTTEPTLEEMTEAALKILKKEPNGFFLMVEGARIDHAMHLNLARKGFGEVIALDKAVDAADKLTDSADTLIAVTADHSHPLTINGYPLRNESILGSFYDDLFDPFYPDYVLDGMPSPLLSFANGFSGALNTNSLDRQNLTGVHMENKDFKTPAYVPRTAETHSGEDVAVYAKGPKAHLFSGTMDDNFIAVAMSYAMCIGPGKALC